MDAHNWRCDCGALLTGLGLMSLSYEITKHDQGAHGIMSTKRTLEQIEDSPQYFRTKDEGPRSQYTTPKAMCSGNGLPTMEERVWLGKQGIAWYGDARTPDELQRRYRNRPASGMEAI